MRSDDVLTNPRCLRSICLVALDDLSSRRSSRNHSPESHLSIACPPNSLFRLSWTRRILLGLRRNRQWSATIEPAIAYSASQNLRSRPWADGAICISPSSLASGSEFTTHQMSEKSTTRACAAIRWRSKPVGGLGVSRRVAALHFPVTGLYRRDRRGVVGLSLRVARDPVTNRGDKR
jgi:hypothetical protein